MLLGGRKLAALFVAFAFVFPIAIAAPTVSISIEGGAANPYISKTAPISIAFTTSNDVNEYQYSCNGSTFFPTGGSDENFSYTLGNTSATKNDFNFSIAGIGCDTSDGNKAVYVRVTGASGAAKTGTAEAVSWVVVDTTAPSITAGTSGGWQTADTNIDFTPTDATSGVASIKYKLDSGSEQTISTSDANYLTLTTDGNHEVEYWAVDNAGNPSSAHKKIWLAIDKSGPAIANISPATPTNNNKPTIAFDINDSLSGIASLQRGTNFRVTIDGNGHTEDINIGATRAWFAFPYHVSDKNVIVVVDTNDAVGNSTRAEFGIVVNTSTPSGLSVTINSGAANTNNASVTLALSASGISQCRFKNNGGSWSSWEDYSASKNWALGSGDGNKTVYYQCKTGAGTESEIVADSIYLDTTAPTVNITAPPSGSTVSPSVTVEYSATDDNSSGYSSGVAKYFVKLDSGEWMDKGTGTSHSFLSLGNGDHTVYVKAVDGLDNNSSATSLSFTVSSSASTTSPDTGSSDSEKPTVEWVSPEDGSSVSGKTELKASASDNIGVSEVVFYNGFDIIGTVTSKTGDYYVFEWDTNEVEEKEPELGVVAKDSAGNQSAKKKITVTVGEGTSAEPGASPEQVEAQKAIDKATRDFEAMERIAGKATGLGLFVSEVTQILENARSALNDAANLVAVADYESVKTFTEKVSQYREELEDKIVIEALKTAEYVVDSNNLSSVSDAARTYLGEVSEQELADAQNVVSNKGVERKIEILKIKDENSEYFKASITLEVKNIFGEKRKFKVREIIPKEFAVDASQIMSSVQFKVIKSDPIIEFEIELEPGEEKQIVYSLNKNLSQEEAEAMEAETIIGNFPAPPIMSTAIEQLDIPLIVYGAGIAAVVALLAAAAFIAIRKKRSSTGFKAPKTKITKKKKFTNEEEEEL